MGADACPFIRRGDYSADYFRAVGAVAETVRIRGGSVAARWAAFPARTMRANASSSPTWTWGEIAEGKYDLDVAGHYTRPDIFRLMGNEQPAPVACFDEQYPHEPVTETDGDQTLGSTLGIREQNK
jgi:nitrilase